MTVGARKFSDLRCEAPDIAHTNRSLSTSKERIFQNHKKHKNSLSPLVILLCCALSRSPVRRLSGVVHPSTSRQAVAPPCGRRTRPPCRDEENNTTFTPKSTPFHPKCTTLLPFPTRGRHDTRPRIRALSEFAIPAFTLHLHTYPSDTQTLARELHPHFLLHRGEGKGGEAFTLITLLSNDLRATGEEVKAKIEKRRTRPRARKTPKRQLDCTSILGVRYLGCATRTTRSKD